MTIQAKQATPRLRFQGFSDNWEEKKLGDIFKITSSKRVYQSEWQSEGIPFYRTREILNLIEGREIKNPIYISEDLYRTHSSKYGKISQGDMLVTGVGTIGKMYVIRGEHDFYFKDGNVIWLKNNPDHYSNFFYYSFQTRHIQKQIEDNASISTVGTYTIDDANKTKMYLPAKGEQSKIADFLMAVDSKLSFLQKKKILLENYKTSITQAIFSQRIRFKDEKAKNYSTWSKETVGRICEISTGSSKSKHLSKSGKYIVVDMGAVSQTGKLLEGKRTDYRENLLQTNDLVMAKDDIGGGNIIGKVVIIPHDNKYVCGDHVYKITAQEVGARYLYYAINSPSVNSSFRRKANGTAQIGITRRTVSEQAIPLPEKKEQEKIANFLTSLDDKIELTENELDQVKQFKKALLGQMFV
jgi:type I restriction enzyme S subunit